MVQTGASHLSEDGLNEWYFSHTPAESCGSNWSDSTLFVSRVKTWTLSDTARETQYMSRAYEAHTYCVYQGPETKLGLNHLKLLLLWVIIKSINRTIFNGCFVYLCYCCVQTWRFPFARMVILLRDSFLNDIPTVQIAFDCWGTSKLLHFCCQKCCNRDYKVQLKFNLNLINCCHNISARWNS